MVSYLINRLGNGWRDLSVIAVFIPMTYALVAPPLLVLAVRLLPCGDTLDARFSWLFCVACWLVNTIVLVVIAACLVYSTWSP